MFWLRVARQFPLHARIAASLVVLATPARVCAWHVPGAESARLCAELQHGPSNKTGFTPGNLFDPKLWAGIAQPLEFHVPDHIGDDIQRVPRPGVQLELFTPGDAGITIHFRW